MGSNWRFVSVIQLEIHVVKFDPLRAASWFELPASSRDKKTLINMKNDDKKCFKWARTKGLNPVDKNPDRVTKLLEEQAEALNWDGLSFPVELKDIRIFEKNNSNISINVFGFDGFVYALEISKEQRERVVHLLLISADINKHYCVIKSFGSVSISTRDSFAEDLH